MKRLMLAGVVSFCSLSAYSASVLAESKAPRIINGDYASIEATPWQAFLTIGNRFQGSYSCGGIIISDNYVLTAAHCVDGFRAGDIKIFAGFESREYSGVGISASAVTMHPDYEDFQFTADIALVKLASALPSTVKPIRLLSPTEQSEMDTEFNGAASQNLYVSGWGSTSTNGDASQYLRKTYLNGVRDLSCSWVNQFGYDQNLADAYVCANETFTTGICSGDSGGPLVWQNKNNAGDADMGYRAVGIVSFSSAFFGCGSPSAEDGFSQISTYYDWINQNMDGGYTEPTPTFTQDIFDQSVNYNPVGNPPIVPVYPGSGEDSDGGEEDVTPPPTPPISGSGGGGSFAWLSLLSLGLLIFRRRLS
ncbi:serine protease [Grimontia kaedaensis]|uniref:Serine protease n=1 Tax=Grimontia kaedaensis TaxID=2872157 RepID=A0ABY4WQR9_9GAMM|nr:serine protease [Grimontia kaedaensis]USH01893.1 serine protease [Grimontia kaedaensis]